MIQQTDISWQTQSWQTLLQSAVRDAATLCQILGLDIEQLPVSQKAQGDFPLLAPLPFVSRMQRGNYADPLLHQVLAVEQEEHEVEGLVDDPLNEAGQNPLPGILHKYSNRVLLTLTSKCAINCRYCFRRHFDYAANNSGKAAWPALLQYLDAHTELDEVILSGGDPLIASDDHLQSLIEKISQIQHIGRLRIHTRLPVVIPQRILQSDLGWLQSFNNTVVVLHINHAQEIDADVVLAAEKLRSAGAILLNQAVLLRGINDELEAQLALHRKCFDAGIMPYYLHLPDQVRGTSHFQVSESQASELMAQLQARLSGYMLPNLVVEQPGMTSKTRLL